MGQLITHIGPNGPRALRIRKNAAVADAIRDSSWTLPHPRSHEEVQLHAYLTTLPLPLIVDAPDIYEWVVGDYPSRDFRSAATWEALRPRQDSKDWVDIVWFKGSIPKHSFNMWIANYDKLPTRARLAEWGLPVSPLCAFCSRGDETRDHVLLSCEYSQDIWREVLLRCRTSLTRFTNWSELLSWIRASTSKKLSILRKIAVQAVVYHLWKQRNNLIHNQTSLTTAALFHGIDREIRNIISARRTRKHFGSLIVMWLR